VVDDDPDVAMVCALHLEGAGFSVLGAVNGKQGLELVASFQPAVVILDYMLPDISGIEVLRRLRGDESTAQIPVVMLTARAHERDQVAAWDAGVSDFVLKPFEGSQLVSAATAAADRAASTSVERRSVRRAEAMERLQGIDRERHAALAAVVDGARDAIIGTNLSGEITFWNAGARQLFGWHADEVLGSPFSVLAAPEHQVELGALLRRAAPVELPCLDRDGRPLRVSLSVSPVCDDEGTVVGASAILRDLTEWLRVEQRFRNVVEACPDGMVIVDGEGRIELVNQRVEELFGHPRAELVGRPVEVLIPVRARGAHVGHRRGYAEGPQSREMGPGQELFGLRADGAEFPVEVSIGPLDSGGGTSYAATVRDVTERRHAAATFRGLLEAAPDAVVGVDATGAVALVNQQAERLFGWSRDQLVGQRVETLVPDWARVGLPVAEDQPALVARRRDGSEFPAEISASAVETEDGVMVSATIRDVSDRTRAEARFRSVVEAAPDAMVIAGEDGRVILVNQQTMRLFGYDREEMVGQPVEMLIPARFRDRHPYHRGSYGRHPRVRPMGAGLELAGLRKDGTEFPVEVSLSPLDTEHGVTISASIRDVTERKRAEAAQSLAFEREREATARLREVDRLRSDFLSTVSHELRTPLTAIKGFAEYLVNAWDATPDDQRRDMVYRILHAGGRLDFLIQDLLDFSKLERGQLRVELTPHHLSALVEEALAHTEASLEHHQVDKQLDGTAMVMADRSAMVRVIENLLTNAAKFSPPGSTIEVCTHSVPDGVLLTVRDEGVGIPETEHEKVFDRFYRVPETAPTHPGTGIGLAIVKQFVEAQGGVVTLRSGERGGTEFHLLLRPAPAAR
jgi:PAS domain S-box-containing protein